MEVRVQVLGEFGVWLDEVRVDSDAWGRRKSAELVQLLALTPGARLHREQVVDALWPELALADATPRLHKAAHFARKALGSTPGVMELQHDVVTLAKDHRLRVDAVEFEQAASTALGRVPPDEQTCAALLRGRPGGLLPGVWEQWAVEHRRRHDRLVVDLLAATKQWEELLRLEPINEAAHLGILAGALERKDRAAGLRAFAAMERVLRDELGISPGPEALALRDALLALGAGTGGPAGGSTTLGERAARDLVERDSELKALHDCVSLARERGRGSVVLISGEAGVGKSAVARAFLDEIPDDVNVDVGGCDDLLAARSLGPFQDMAQAPGTGDARVLDLLEHGTTPDIMRQLLDFLTRAPTVALIEDLHWADDATLDVFRFLARRVAGVPVVLVATFRTAGLTPEHPLVQLLGTLLGDHVVRLPLEPLTRDAVRRLGGFSDAEAAEVHRITGGNPFFVTEVVAAGVDAVPATVRDAVLGRIGALAAEVQIVLRTLSVVPGHVERWLAEALTEDSAALIGAEASGVLIGDAGEIAFRHELARRAVESSLTPTERLAAHREVLDVLLEETGVSPARLVHHAALGGRHRQLVEIGPAAAVDAARQGAHRQSAEILRLVLEAPNDLSDATAARLWSERSYSSYVVNRFEEAFSYAEQAVGLGDRAGDDSVLVDALPVLARAAMFARGPEEARSAAQRAVDVARRGPDEGRLAAALTELARAHSNLPSVSVVARPSSASEAAAVEALAVAEALARPDLVARALCYRGEARMARGDLDGFADLEQAVELAGADPRVETRVRCLVNAAGSAFRAGRLPDVERLVEQGLTLAGDCEFFAGEYRLRLTRAAARASAGAWDSAVDELEDLLGSPGEPGIMAPLARSVLARVLARRGDPHARAVLAAAWADPRRTRSPFVRGVLEVAAAELGWLDGSLADITPTMAAVLRDATAGGHPVVAAELTAYLRRADVPVGDPPEAPGPWAPTLAGRTAEAAAAWSRLGERYEAAVVRATSSEPSDQQAGVDALVELGAVATIPALG